MITQLEAERYTIRGVSLGGVYTSLHVPQLDTLFDVGFPLRSAASVDHLFLSHGHVDHMGALATLLGIRGLVGVRRNLQVFLPGPLAPVVREALSATSRIHRWPLEVDVVPLEPGDVVSLRADLYVRAFRTYHPVPSLGYLLFRRVHKLRPEYSGLPGPEIARRRRAGEDLLAPVDRLELAYATDTLPVVLEREPELLRVPLLILECTFLDARKSIADARAGCHIHLDELLPFADDLQNQDLVLMHFSQLYKPAEVRRILTERCPPQLMSRIRPFVPEGDTWPG